MSPFTDWGTFSKALDEDKKDKDHKRSHSKVPTPPDEPAAESDDWEEWGQRYGKGKKVGGKLAVPSKIDNARVRAPSYATLEAGLTIPSRTAASKKLPEHKVNLQAKEFPTASKPVYIALMGVTGTGKSTFISHCTDKKPAIGHDLESCKLRTSKRYVLVIGLTSSCVQAPQQFQYTLSNTTTQRQCIWLTRRDSTIQPKATQIYWRRSRHS